MNPFFRSAYLAPHATLAVSRVVFCVVKSHTTCYQSLDHMSKQRSLAPKAAQAPNPPKVRETRARGEGAKTLYIYVYLYLGCIRFIGIYAK